MIILAIRIISILLLHMRNSLVENSYLTSKQLIQQLSRLLRHFCASIILYYALTKLTLHQVIGKALAMIMALAHPHYNENQIKETKCKYLVEYIVRINIYSRGISLCSAENSGWSGELGTKD